MTTPREFRQAEETLDLALSTNDGRIWLFRQLAAYEAAESYEAWCRRWRLDPRDQDASNHWSLMHLVYIVAWTKLGDLFARYLQLGYVGLALGGRP